MRSIFQDKLEDRLRTFAGFSSLPTMFSLADLTQDLAAAIPPGPIAEKVLPVADRFLFLAAQDLGLELEVELRPDLYGPGAHLISLIASQQSPIVHASDIGAAALLSVETRFPDNTCALFIDDWLWLTARCGSLLGYQLPQSTQPQTIRVVEENRVIAGLKSFPGTDILVPVDCGPGQEICAF